MNRRDFLKLGAAAAAVTAVPSGIAMMQADGGLRIDQIRNAVMIMRGAVLDSGWYAFVHPSVEADIRELKARTEWKFAHKCWRADGKPQMTCQQVLERYRPLEETRLVSAEFGRCENVRYITSPSVLS